MTNEERLCKINLLKDFCTQHCINEDELYELFSQMEIIKEGSSLEIYYEDGEVSRRIDLAKKPIAFRISSVCKSPLCKERELWVLARVLKNANFEQVQAFIKTLPKISSYSWRVPQERELTYVLDTKRHLEDLEKLRYVFSLPCFIDDERDCLTCFIDDERDCLTCLDNSDRLESVMYYYPDFRIEGINPTEKLSWWVVCDAD